MKTSPNNFNENTIWAILKLFLIKYKELFFILHIKHNSFTNNSFFEDKVQHPPPPHNKNLVFPGMFFSNSWNNSIYEKKLIL